MEGGEPCTQAAANPAEDSRPSPKPIQPLPREELAAAPDGRRNGDRPREVSLHINPRACLVQEEEEKG